MHRVRFIYYMFSLLQHNLYATDELEVLTQILNLQTHTIMTQFNNVNTKDTCDRLCCMSCQIPSMSVFVHTGLESLSLRHRWVIMWCADICTCQN